MLLKHIGYIYYNYYKTYNLLYFYFPVVWPLFINIVLCLNSKWYTSRVLVIVFVVISLSVPMSKFYISVYILYKLESLLLFSWLILCHHRNKWIVLTIFKVSSIITIARAFIVTFSLLFKHVVETSSIRQLHVF